MFLNKKPWDTVETPDKIQMLTKSISKVQKYHLLTTNQYVQQMELVIEIINDITKGTSKPTHAIGVNEVPGLETVAPPQTSINARAKSIKYTPRSKSVLNNYMMHFRSV